MTREKFLLACGVVLMGIGLTFILLTTVVVAQFLVGIEPSPIVLNLERNIGSALLAIGLVNVLGRKSTDAVGLRAIIYGTLAVLILTAALDVYSVLIGIFAPIGWGVVVFKAVLSGGYLYHLGKVGRGGAA
jgi:hypothetical protein